MRALKIWIYAAFERLVNCNWHCTLRIKKIFVPAPLFFSFGISFTYYKMKFSVNLIFPTKSIISLLNHFRKFWKVQISNYNLIFLFLFIFTQFFPWIHRSIFLNFKEWFSYKFITLWENKTKRRRRFLFSGAWLLYHT